MSDNLIKSTCKELNLTYKQLGEAIGMISNINKKIRINNDK
jgi:hypothetical protein